MRKIHLLQGKHRLAVLSHPKMSHHVKGKHHLKGHGIGAFVPREEGEGIKKHHRLKPLKFKMLG